MTLLIILLVSVGLQLTLTTCSTSTTTVVTRGDKSCIEAIVDDYKYDKFYSISDIKNSTHDGFLIDLPIEVTTMHGNSTRFILLTENDKLGSESNKNMEIDKFRHYLSINDCLYGNKTVDLKEPYVLPIGAKISVFVSVEQKGYIKVSSDADFKNLTTKSVPNVKFISFTGYSGVTSKFTFCNGFNISPSTIFTIASTIATYLLSNVLQKAMCESVLTS